MFITEVDMWLLDTVCTFCLCLLVVLICLGGVVFVGYIVKEICDIVMQWREDKHGNQAD